MIYHAGLYDIYIYILISNKQKPIYRMYTKRGTKFSTAVCQAIDSTEEGRLHTMWMHALKQEKCEHGVSQPLSECHSRYTQGESGSLSDALVGVLVVAVLHVQLLSTAHTVAHLWRAPQEKKQNKTKLYNCIHTPFTCNKTSNHISSQG